MHASRSVLQLLLNALRQINLTDQHNTQYMITRLNLARDLLTSTIKMPTHIGRHAIQGKLRVVTQIASSERRSSDERCE